MSRASWHETMRSKSFDIVYYRRLTRLVVVSFLLNAALCYLAVHLFLSRPEPIYYSTNGATPPVQLTPLDEPNDSSVALLPSDTASREKQQPKIAPE